MILTGPNMDSVSVYTETESNQPAGQSPHRKRLFVALFKSYLCVAETRYLTSMNNYTDKVRISEYNFYWIILLKENLHVDVCWRNPRVWMVVHHFIVHLEYTCVVTKRLRTVCVVRVKYSILWSLHVCVLVMLACVPTTHANTGVFFLSRWSDEQPSKLK